MPNCWASVYDWSKLNVNPLKYFSLNKYKIMHDDGWTGNTVMIYAVKAHTVLLPVNNAAVLLPRHPEWKKDFWTSIRNNQGGLKINMPDKC